MSTDHDTPSATLKTCTACGVAKPTSDFSPLRGLTPNRLPAILRRRGATPPSSGQVMQPRFPVQELQWPVHPSPNRPHARPPSYAR
jgi:hypothetical protein